MLAACRSFRQRSHQIDGYFLERMGCCDVSHRGTVLRSWSPAPSLCAHVARSTPSFLDVSGHPWPIAIAASPRSAYRQSDLKLRWRELLETGVDAVVGAQLAATLLDYRGSLGRTSGTPNNSPTSTIFPNKTGDYSLPDFQPLAVGSFTWGRLSRDCAIQVVESAYSGVVHWRRNIFYVPSGSAGKQFVQELSKLYQAYANASAMECIALKAATILAFLQFSCYNGRTPTPQPKSMLPA